MCGSVSLPSTGACDVLKECVEPKVNYGLSKPKKTCLLTFLKLVSKMDSNEPENGKELQLGMKNSSLTSTAPAKAKLPPPTRETLQISQG